MRRIMSMLMVMGGLCAVGLGVHARADEPLRVTVSIVPQKYFLQKIGGERVEVTVMVPPGATAERYDPRPQQMVALGESKVYFAMGIPFETTWLPKITAANRNMLVVHMDEGVAKRVMEAHLHEGEPEGAGQQAASPDEPHAHGGLKDPHVWLSPPLVMLQARNALDGLLKVDPEHRELYTANYKKFISELVELDLTIKDIFRGQDREASFLVFHPAWGYFADAYGLKQIPVEIEGKEPKARDLERFIALVKARKSKILFVQPQFSTRSAQTIADAAGARIMAADDLAEDWARNLLEVARAIAASLEP